MDTTEKTGAGKCLARLAIVIVLSVVGIGATPGTKALDAFMGVAFDSQDTSDGKRVWFDGIGGIAHQFDPPGKPFGLLAYDKLTIPATRRVYGVHGCHPYSTAAEAKTKWEATVKEIMRSYDVLPTISEYNPERTKSWRAPVIVCAIRSAVFQFADSRTIECVAGIQDDGLFRVDLVAIDENAAANKLPKGS